MAELVLTGLGVSVYTRVARMALAEKGLSYRFEAVNPFVDAPDPVLARLTPFNRVPVLTHDGFSVYETAAILRYLEAAFPEPSLAPEGARAAARMAQVIGVVDSYAYWPLVRQVFSQRVFRPLEGLAPDEDEIAKGLQAAGPVLGALEGFAAEGLAQNRSAMTLADIHLAPMLDYFAMAAEGAALLGQYPQLSDWFGWVQQQPSFRATGITLPGPARH